jgi:translation initiation factor IF-3
MDFGKFQYEQSKKRHAAKRKQKQIQIKEVKFRPGTGIGDYQIKLRNLIKFLEAGDKAKITLRFRGREMAHQEIGMQLLRRIEADLKNYGTVEQHARMEGRQMVMMVAPDRKAASGNVSTKSTVAEHKPAAEPKAAVKQTVAG